MNRCPSEEQLDLFLEDRLAQGESRRVGAHVGDCERCQSVLKRLTLAGAEQLSGVLTPSRAGQGVASDTQLPADFLLRLRHARPGDLAVHGPSTPAIPTELPQVPGYEIIREIGRGGMGVVYQARHLGLNRLVALKMLRAGLTGPKDMARFREEAEAVARLQHPNIVQIYDIGESAGRPFLALEYVPGAALVHHLRGDPQPVYPAARLIETLAKAVHVAHAHGVVHRDLKPSNVLVQAQGLQPLTFSAVKIADFGLAKRLDSHSSGTDTGEVVGTPSYMAPEQAASGRQKVGPAADVYALGAILYELLTGRPPFKGSTSLDTVLQVIHEEPIRPARLRPKVPADLETICLKCLEKEPSRRYPSALALAEDLRRFLHGSPIQARPVSLQEWLWKWARRKPVHAALILGLVLVTVLGFAGVTWQWREAAAARDTTLAEKREKEEQKEEAERARAVAEEAERSAAEQRRQARVALYYSRIAQSELQWRVNDFSSAEQTLADCMPAAGLVDRRGWEWYYLRGLYRTELLTLPHQTEGVGGGLDVRADGRWIASVQGGYEPGKKEKPAEVRLWDARNGKVIHAWSMPSTFHRLAFNPDGSRLALASTDGKVVVRDTQTLQDIMDYQPHTDVVSAVAFSPDGKRLASAGWDGVVQIRELNGDDSIQSLRQAGRVYHLAFHPDGRLLATAGGDGSVRIWDSVKGEIVQIIRGHSSNAVFSVAFNPDGELLVSAGSNGDLKIWETATGRITQSLTGQAGAVLNVVFSPDGRYLAYGGGDTTVRVWDVESGVERIAFRGHTNPVNGVRFTPDGLRLISASAGQAAVKVWDLTRHPEFATLARTVADIEALAFRDDGQRLVSITLAGKLQTWNAASGVLETERTLPLWEKTISPSVLASFSEDGLYLAARGQGDGKLVQVWDVTTGAQVAALDGHRSAVSCLRFSSDGQYVATAESEATKPGQAVEVRIWDARKGLQLATVRSEGAVSNLAFSADGQHLAIGSQSGALTVMDWMKNRTDFRTLAHRGDVTGLVFSPDGHRLASAGVDDRAVKIWDLAAASLAPKVTPALTLAAPLYVCDLAFSPNGRRLAGISRDLVKIWDAETGYDVLTLRGAPQRHYDPAFNPRILFSPDGNRLVGTNWNESISLWDAGAIGGEGSLLRRQVARRRAADQRAAIWHVEEAEHCLEHKNPSAATFHLKQLDGINLPEPLRTRRNQVIAQMEKAGK